MLELRYKQMNRRSFGSCGATPFSIFPLRLAPTNPGNCGSQSCLLPPVDITLASCLSSSHSTLLPQFESLANHPLQMVCQGTQNEKAIWTPSMLRGVSGQLTVTLISSPLLWTAGYAEDIHVGLNQGQAYKSLSCNGLSASR